MKQIIIKSILIFIVLFVVIGLGKNVYTEPIESNAYLDIEMVNSEENLEEDFVELFNSSGEIKKDEIEIKEPNIIENGILEEPLNENISSNKDIKDNLNLISNENVNSSITEELNQEEEILQKNGHIIAIDAGHQQKQNTEKEPIGPGALETKQKVSSGTQGILSKLPEYELTLDVSLMLKKALENEGYEVIMIRETNDVDLSNAERAEIANNSGAEIFLRIHADGSESESTKGVTTLCPTKNNEYCAFIAEDSYNLSKYIVDNLSEKTLDTNRGVSRVDNMTGINWCKIPVSIVEIGFMTNKETDELFQTKEYKEKIVEGIVNGVNDYFGGF